MKIPKKTDKIPQDNKRYINPLAQGTLRNKPCICGSGKKIKRCHGQDMAVSVHKLNQITRMLQAANKANGVAHAHQDKDQRQPESSI